MQEVRAGAVGPSRSTSVEVRDLRAAWAVALGLAVASASGVFTGVYDVETAFARHAFRGADLVSLFVITPLLGYGTVRTARGSVRGQMLLLGCLAYVTYQYAYVFAYRWNRLFLLYLVLLSLSAFTLARILFGLSADAVRDRCDARVPVRAVRWFLVSVAVVLAAAELAQILPTIVTGEVPRIVSDTGHPTSPVYVLDLGLVAPMMWITAGWLSRGSPWGYVVAPILLLKAAGIGLGLLAGNAVAWVDDGMTDGPLVGLWAVIAVGGGAALWAFLRHVPDVRTS